MADTRHDAGVATVVGALGVVFGDIGTSPLYALHSMLGEAGTSNRDVVYGLTSLVVWSLLLVVTVLYVGLLLRADNEGEGGLLALVGLLRRTSLKGRTLVVVTVLGMAGAAMFLGDCVITPAISVLSAAEGLEVASPSAKVIVLPVALALLIGVFVIQRWGSGKIGRFYGPVMAVWFGVLVATGVGSLAQSPQVVQALSPTWAVRFLAEDPLAGFLSLGSVILAVTGAEALYADLAHFGRRAITRAWLVVVLPALVLAYLGEAGAVLREGKAAASEPFYAVVPGWATIPVLVTATLATVIASEAVIAGAFTVLHQAGGLGLFPVLRTHYTSAEEPGRIYLPGANWVLAAVVLLMVALFRDSTKLSQAYGVAVSTTFLATATLYLLLLRSRASARARFALTLALMVVLVAFSAASVPKIVSGGWAPLGIGTVMFMLMTTWWSGQRRLSEGLAQEESSPEDVLEKTAGADSARVPGAEVYLTRDRRVVPMALRTLVDFERPLAERVVLLHWTLADTPGSPAERAHVTVDTLDDRFEGVLAVEVQLGYRERLDVRQVLRDACERAPAELEGIDPDTARYMVSEAIPRVSREGHMARWRQRLFVVMDRLSGGQVDQLRLPRERALVVGREYPL